MDPTISYPSSRPSAPPLSGSWRPPENPVASTIAPYPPVPQLATSPPPYVQTTTVFAVTGPPTQAPVAVQIAGPSIPTVAYPHMRPQTMIVSPGRDHHADQPHQYCCGCCPITTCAYIIGVLEVIGLLAALIISIIDYRKWSGTTFYHAMLASSICFVVGVLIVGLSFFGLAKRRPMFVLPLITFQSLSIGGFLAGIAWYIYLLVSYMILKTHEYDGDRALAFWSIIVVIIVCAIAIPIQIGFMLQVIKAFRYLKTSH